MCMQDVAIAIKNLTKSGIIADASVNPLTISGDPALLRLTILGKSATTIPRVTFKGLAGSAAIPLDSALGVQYPVTFDREHYGALLDKDIVIGADAIGQVAWVAIYLDPFTLAAALQVGKDING